MLFVMQYHESPMCGIYSLSLLLWLICCMLLYDKINSEIASLAAIRVFGLVPNRWQCSVRFSTLLFIISSAMKTPRCSDR